MVSSSSLITKGLCRDAPVLSSSPGEQQFSLELAVVFPSVTSSSDEDSQDEILELFSRTVVEGVATLSSSSVSDAGEKEGRSLEGMRPNTSFIISPALRASTRVRSFIRALMALPTKPDKSLNDMPGLESATLSDNTIAALLALDSLIKPEEEANERFEKLPENKAGN